MTERRSLVTVAGQPRIHTGVPVRRARCYRGGVALPRPMATRVGPLAAKDLRAPTLLPLDR
jgi:hypothetical protein